MQPGRRSREIDQSSWRKTSFGTTGARARGLRQLGGEHCAAIRHNAGGQPSPAVESAVRARSMLSFGGFGVAQLSLRSLGRCSARKARQAYATRVLSVGVFNWHKIPTKKG